MTDQPKLTLIPGGITSYEQYKKAVNAFCRSMLGRDSDRTEEEMQVAWKRLQEKIEGKYTDTEKAE